MPPSPLTLYSVWAYCLVALQMTNLDAKCTHVTFPLLSTIPFRRLVKMCQVYALVYSEFVSAMRSQVAFPCVASLQRLSFHTLCSFSSADEGVCATSLRSCSPQTWELCCHYPPVRSDTVCVFLSVHFCPGLLTEGSSWPLPPWLVNHFPGTHLPSVL